MDEDPGSRASPSSINRRQTLGAAIGFGLYTRAVQSRSTVSAAVIEPRSAAFATLVDPAAVVETLYAEGRWCEGPVWSPADGGLVFSDVRANRLMCLRADRSVDVVRDPSNNGNGNAIDRQGRLLTCEHRSRAVVRREADGRRVTLVDRYEGRRLNAPNDLAVADDGAVWFTDPIFGITQPDEGLQAEPEQKFRHVFRCSVDGRLSVVSDTFDQPNGIAFSPDFKTLYVSEAGAALDPDGGGREIRAFDVQDDGTVRRERVFARLDTGLPDGLTTDERGCVYAATMDGIRVWAADGRPLGLIRTAGTCGNVAFGGADGRTLFICSGKHIHALPMRVRGAGRSSTR
ncbi:MAG: SMP-30/gluconolactonase/LRE family protein [Janthinobacterium lividum]